MRRLRDEAIVLNRRDLGEADRIVVLLCRKSGKISAVAPGGRRSQRRFGGSLDLFVRSEFMLVDKGRGGLARLEEAHLLDTHAGIRTDLVSIAHAGYIAELISALLKEWAEVEEIYHLFSAVLKELAFAPLPAISLRKVELDLLGLAGLSPHLDDCLACGSETSDGWLFDHDQGGVFCDGCGQGAQTQNLTIHEVRLLRELQQGQTPESVPSQAMDSMRRLLARIFDYHIQRPLKARSFLHSLALSK